MEGAWQLLRAVTAQDPSAPSWQFLQQHWEQTSGTAMEPAHAGSQHSNITAALLLQVMLLWIEKILHFCSTLTMQMDTALP